MHRKGHPPFKSIEVPTEAWHVYSDTANRNKNHFITILSITCNRKLKCLNMQSESFPCVIWQMLKNRTLMICDNQRLQQSCWN